MQVRILPGEPILKQDYEHHKIHKKRDSQNVYARRIYAGIYQQGVGGKRKNHISHTENENKLFR